MSLSASQIPQKYKEVVDREISVFRKGRSITVRNDIPDTTAIPIENRKHWLRIPDVICVLVDMVGSTRLSAIQHDRSTAGAYQLFTETAVRLFAEFEAPYIDVKGDGAFALFNAGQEYRAFASAITMKTFVKEEFVPRIKKKAELELGSHIGIDQKTLLVRKVGLKRVGGRSDRQNEVWAGRPVNMAAKLASISAADELRVSDRFFSRITDDLVRESCGCPDGTKVPLWNEQDLSEDDRFDFDKAHFLTSSWCGKHGAEYCEAVINLDGE